MYQPGDLVLISLDCPIKYFRQRTALVVKDLGVDATDHSNGFYYMLKFDDNSTHVFMDSELTLLSRAVSEV